jgi:hypothetical protein
MYKLYKDMVRFGFVKICGLVCIGSATIQSRPNLLLKLVIFLSWTFWLIFLEIGSGLLDAIPLPEPAPRRSREGA